MDKEYIYTVLKQQAMEWTGYPTWGLRTEHFRAISNHNWAVNEVLKQIRLSDAPPQEVIASFMHEMDECARKNDLSRQDFEQCRDAVYWMLEVLNAMIPPEIEEKGV